MTPKAIAFLKEIATRPAPKYTFWNLVIGLSRDQLRAEGEMAAAAGLALWVLKQEGEGEWVNENLGY